MFQFGWLSWTLTQYIDLSLFLFLNVCPGREVEVKWGLSLRQLTPESTMNFETKPKPLNYYSSHLL